MNRTFSITVLALGWAGLTTAALAAPASDFLGPYVGIGLGSSQVGTTGVATQKFSSDEHDRAAKLYAGYPLSENFGLEAGYLRLGQFQGRFSVGGAEVSQTAQVRSLYLAGTARLPLGAGFALTSKAGLSFGRVTGTDHLGGNDRLIGSHTSAVLGVGAAYRLSRDVAVTIDLDTVGKTSNRLSASGLTAGLQFFF